mmetsp:Transcript_11226/g.31106  ORF Transcript_11226/g.31106 Transcript_11226/m.31106 type:complete len:212 (-) Transcript_11226:1001-1636(-)
MVVCDGCLRIRHCLPRARQVGKLPLDLVRDKVVVVLTVRQIVRSSLPVRRQHHASPHCDNLAVHGHYLKEFPSRFELHNVADASTAGRAQTRDLEIGANWSRAARSRVGWHALSGWNPHGSMRPLTLVPDAIGRQRSAQMSPRNFRAHLQPLAFPRHLSPQNALAKMQLRANTLQLPAITRVLGERLHELLTERLLRVTFDTQTLHRSDIL